MGRNGFHPNRRGYAEVLNGDDAYHACHSAGGSMAQTANMAGHGEYAFDTIRGRTRIHTRVKTTDRKSYYQERSTRTLARIAGHYG